jgi:hypothetical protein
VKHDLINRSDDIRLDYDYSGHTRWHECRRCGDLIATCCDEGGLKSECPSGQMELFPLDECGPVVLY